MTQWDMLSDLKSIKLQPEDRTFVLAAVETFRGQGGVGPQTRDRLIELHRRHRRQIREVNEAREKARYTNGIKKLGLTRGEVAERAKARSQEEDRARSDLGI